MTAAAPARPKIGEIWHPVIVSDEALAAVNAILIEYIETYSRVVDAQTIRAVKRAREVRHQIKIRRLEARRKTDWGRKEAGCADPA
jgi:hypothetical protein